VKLNQGGYCKSKILNRNVMPRLKLAQNMEWDTQNKNPKSVQALNRMG
jgi:hypothetical protein